MSFGQSDNAAVQDQVPESAHISDSDLSGSIWNEIGSDLDGRRGDDTAFSRSLSEPDVLDFTKDDIFGEKDGGLGVDEFDADPKSDAEGGLDLNPEYIEASAKVIPIERTEESPYGKKLEEVYNKNEGYTERRFEDGTVQKEYDDGLKVTRVAGGAKVIEQPDGWSIVMNPYGTDHLYGPNGEEIHSSHGQHRPTEDIKGNKYRNEEHRRQLTDKDGKVIMSAAGPKDGGPIIIWDAKEQKYREV